MPKPEQTTTFARPLATVELDIDELERRLELAAAVSAPPGWCGRDGCATDCAAVCSLSGG